MWNIPNLARLARIPSLYKTEHIQLRDKPIHLHFFIGSCDWFVAEYDGENLFWGFAILNSDFQNAEWGYISFTDLKNIRLSNGAEIDCEILSAFSVQPAHQVDLIRKAHSW